jgi:hypothetical protein
LTTRGVRCIESNSSPMTNVCPCFPPFLCTYFINWFHFVNITPGHTIRTKYLIVARTNALYCH